MSDEFSNRTSNVNGKPQSYCDLLVWQKGISLAKIIYKLTAEFPSEEKFGLEHFHQICSAGLKVLTDSGLLGFWLRFRSVTGFFKPALSRKPRHKPKILAAHRYIFSVNALVSQMRRAAVSVPSNIAEGQARNTAGEFVLFISHAEGSLAELDTQLILATERGFLSTEKANPCASLITELRRMLNGLRRAVSGQKPAAQNSKRVAP